MPRSGNKAGDPLTQSDRFRNVRWITRPPQGARSVGIALSWCRWTPTMALPMALWAHSRGPKPGMYPKNVQCGRLYFRYILSDHADKRSLCKFIFSTAVKCDHKLFLRHPVCLNPPNHSPHRSSTMWAPLPPASHRLARRPLPRDTRRAIFA